ncbi:uncharacterized protein STEHIDRAFT_172281 [Stereum hirsutum FP-91666 SS1]|uniref:uncharacterized protein n=1 Tax=Stereum hirsutum (strain FP-91666) TaxID=721885 RepID=UPI000444A71A|nr:uncharacterized protein STEHIDRAFT_172281 [Stereum hirsutum FP-91666 SS1]EIM81313.1 hypothetical protein STEHIDRAFT_172281 [Stereum hirsutum FP-91666 SS1]
MSRPQIPTKSSVASRTKYELLAVDDADDESEQEEQEEEQPEPTQESATPVKLTKTAQRKAAKAARLEKQQRKRGSVSPSPAGGASPSPVPPAVLPPTPPPEPASLPKSSATPKESTTQAPVSPEPESTNEVSPAIVVDSAETPAQNGHAHEHIAEPQTAPAPVIAHSSVEPAPAKKDYSAPQAKPEAKAPASAPVTQPVQSEPKAVVDAVAEDHAKEHKEERHVELKESSPPKANESEKEKKRQNALTRTVWTLIMIGGFLTILAMGHGYMVILVMLCQTLVYREVTRLFTLTGSKADADKAGKDPWSQTLNWYFFVVTNYFLYGESIIYYFKHVVFADSNLLPFATNHRIISFTLYTIGFMGFVMSLKKGYLKQQFGLFCWVHMSLLLIVVSSHFIVNNILEGLIWLWVPASLVICNDIFAYIWGITLGRTPLIKLSPKKTVEGFVGAFLSTIVFAILWGTYFARFNYMICPVHDLGVNIWSDMQCTPNPVFVWRDWQIWKPVAASLSTFLRRQITTIPYTPYQIHLFFMACFASLVAPFGGFFASGFKRAFNIKDFGHSIPGHGGMTDRMDCQFLMGVFVYVYHSSLIREHHVTVGSVLQTIVSGLSTEEQLELLRDMKRYLEGQGISVGF